MSQPRDDRQDDLFRSSLEQIINLRHPLVRLAAVGPVLAQSGRSYANSIPECLSVWNHARGGGA